MRKTKWIAAFLSCTTMCLSPLAQGAAQERQNLAEAKEMVQVLGLVGPQKVKNLGELWERFKYNLPVSTRTQMEPWINLHRQEALPEISLQQVDGVKQDIVRLTMSKGKESLTLELSDDPMKLVKIQDQTLSAFDLWWGKGAYNKLNKIPLVAEATVKQQKELLRRSIVPTFEQFKKMTKVDRAYYLVHLRQLLQSADEVQQNTRAERLKKSGRIPASEETTTEDSKSPDTQKEESKTDSPDSAAVLRNFDKYEAAIKWLMGDEAGAAGKAKSTTTAKPKAKITSIYNGDCVVAGYVSEYSSDKTGNYCNHLNIIVKNETIKDTFNKNNTICTQLMGVNSIACNPTVYGYTEGGAPACVAISRSKGSEFQTATKQCDLKLPLQTSADAARMVKSLLKDNGKDLSKYFDGDKVQSKDLFDELMKDIVGPTELYVAQAIEQCSSKSKHEPNQDSACETLKNRKGQLALLFGQVEIKDTPAKPEPPASCKPEEKDSDGNCCLPPKKLVPDDSTTGKSGKDGGSKKLTCSTMAEGAGDDSSGVADDPKKADLPPEKMRPEAKNAEKCDKFYCQFGFWAASAAILGTAWWLYSRNKKKRSSKKYVPPVPPICVTNCSTTTPPTDPPPPITPTPTSEGGKGTGTSGASGSTR